MVGILVTLIISDIVLVRIYDVVSKQFLSITTKQLLFGLISISILVVQQVLLRFMRNGATSEKRRLDIFSYVQILSYTLAVVVVSLFIQTVFLSYYTTSLLLAGIVLSYSISATTMVFLLSRILGYFFARKATLPLIVFLVVISSLTINAIVGALDVFLRLGDRPIETRPYLSGSMDVSKGRYDSVDNLYFITYLLSFIAAWSATSVMLSHYGKKFGKVKYWLLVALPLLFFWTQFIIPLANIMAPRFSIDPFVLANWISIMLTISKPIAGLMLAVQFWAVAKIMSKKSIIRFYLVISGFGFLLVFTCNQAILMSIAPYPPFGIATITAMVISSYLVVRGVYGSSISMSRDLELRQKIRKFAMSETKLLDSILSGENEKILQSKVKEIIKFHSRVIQMDTGVQMPIDEEEITEYVQEVKRVRWSMIRKRGSDINSPGNSPG